jgi:hypothetical protein
MPLVAMNEFATPWFWALSAPLRASDSALNGVSTPRIP